MLRERQGEKREKERRGKMDHAAEANRTDLMTITRFVLNEQSKYPESRGDFTILLSNIVLGCKFVCTAVNKVSLSFPIHLSLFLFLLLNDIFFYLLGCRELFDRLTMYFLMTVSKMIISFG